MLYCAHNITEDRYAVVSASSIDEAGNVASDFWLDCNVVVLSLEVFIKDHGGMVELQ